VPCSNNDVAIASNLSEYGAHVDAINNELEAPLHDAYNYGNHEKVYETTAADLYNPNVPFLNYNIP